MKKIAGILVLFSVVGVINAQDKKPSRPADETDEVVRISTSLIQIDVTVTDSKGNVVTGLKPTDFEIFENGERQKISSFSFFSGAKPVDPQSARTRNPVDVPVPSPAVMPVVCNPRASTV